MSYREEVQGKILSSAESSEGRMKLWEEVCSAYEQGGVEQVGSRLTDRMKSLEERFEQVIEKLQGML